MCKTCQACVNHATEVIRKLKFGQAKTAEELRKVENTISGFKEYAPNPSPSKPAEGNILQGGGVLQELARQRLFGYARNEKGEQVHVTDTEVRQGLRREIENEAVKSSRIAQGAAADRCPSCLCPWE
jgi:hypothetical protein